MSEKHSGCEECRFLLRQDFGYSNWTPMGETVDCLLNKHPSLPTDDPDNVVLTFGEACPYFSAGVPAAYDVDGEVTAEDYKNDPEVYAILKARQGEAP